MVLRSLLLPALGLPGPSAAEEEGQRGGHRRSMALSRSGAFSLTRACMFPGHTSPAPLHWRLHSPLLLSASAPQAALSLLPVEPPQGLSPRRVAPWKVSPVHSVPESHGDSTIPRASAWGRSGCSPSPPLSSMGVSVKGQSVPRGHPIERRKGAQEGKIPWGAALGAPRCALRQAPGAPALARGASVSAAAGAPAGTPLAAQEAESKTSTGADAEAVELPEVHLGAPPPGLEELEKVAEWVVFSDLHLRSQNCDVCMDVLRYVHRQAQERGAGILFLGDFWHVRASLPVRPLNAAVEEIASWTQPTLMLPGNHDQVTEDGREHALLPLGAVNPRVHVISEPALFLGALWLPYRRDGRLVEAAVRKHAGDVSAIFAHIDVAGAAVNNSLQLQLGMSPRVFPPGLPVFTGHYHKPHVVAGTAVEYVGSPYQTSLAEAGQAKHLLLLRAPGWQRAGEIPLQFGRRFHVLEGEGRPWEALGALEGVQAGDFLRWQVPEGMEEAAVLESLARLKEMRLSVDVVHPPRASKPRMNLEPSKRLDPLSVLSAYQETMGLSQNVVEEAARILGSLEDVSPGLLHRPKMHLVLDEVRLEGYGPFRSPTVYPLRARGLRIVSGANQDSSGSDSNGAGKTSLVMAPLWALAGCTDSRSPGSTYKGLTRDEVKNDEADCARVAVTGSINGKPFSVERTAGKRSSLRFVLDGQDLTCQEIKLTQNRINEHIPTAFLPFTVFHGQHSTGNILLEASDAELKDLLGKVTGMDVWVRAKEQSKEVAGERQRRCDAAKARSAERQSDLKSLQAQRKRAQQDASAWDAHRSREVSALEALGAEAGAQLRGKLLECAQRSRQVQGALEAWDQYAATLKAEIKALTALAYRGDASEGNSAGTGARAGVRAGVEPGTPWESVSQELEALTRSRNALREQIAESEGEMKGRTSALQKRQRRLQQFAQATSGGTEDAATPVCDRCLQPLNPEHMEMCRQQLEAEVEEAATLEETSRKGIDEKRRELRGVEEQVQAVQRQIQEAQRQMQAASEAARHRRREEERARADAMESKQEKLRGIDRCYGFAANLLRDAADLLSQSPLGAEIAEELQRAEEGAGAGVGEAEGLGRGEQRPGLDAVNDLISQAMGALNAAKQAQGRASSLAQDLEAKRKQSNPHAPHLLYMDGAVREKAEETDAAVRELQEAMAQLHVMKEVDKALGGGGIQSCLLETALDDLQARAAAYLEAISGGSLHLRLSATQEKKAKASGKAAAGPPKEAIELVVSARVSDGRLIRRSLAQLSGGERRRLGLALCLGFASFAEHHTGLSSDLIVLDEVMQHLDEEGQSRVLGALRNLPQSTVLLVSQANSAEAWDATAVDWVVRAEDCSTVQCASDALLSTGAYS